MAWTLNSYNRIVLFVLILLLLASCNNSYERANIHGNWIGSFNDHELLFIFRKDSTCFLKFFNEQSNAYDSINGNYELDYSKKPIPLSIQNIPELSYSLHTIIKFIEHDSVRIAEFSSRWRLRPITFDADKTMNLKRVK